LVKCKSSKPNFQTNFPENLDLSGQIFWTLESFFGHV
jgi:hypothetical protein